FNGHLQHTLYPKIHFTGSINPGMSGGPTISNDGRVVGINVATSGEQVSFLVPVDRAIALVERAAAPGYEPPDSMLQEIARQITDYQAVYLEGMFDESAKVVELGPYRAVTEPAPFFRCWGYASRERELPYESVSHRCSTDDYLFIAGDQRSGTVQVTHQLLTTESLGRFRFHALYSAVFGEDNTPGGTEEHVTKWRCATRNVRNDSAPLRAVLCLRRYRKLDALYDAVLKVAVLGGADTGLVSTLSLSGVTHESIDELSQRYLERITWR
ncbi:MAG TPA: S1C family serine protease, partial [Longimicrobiales bacterium]|nr:S1C family serine protease [Longimicrobiales bacterium]